MSGIVGLFNLVGEPIAPAVLTHMLQAIQHRGPDGSRGWCDGVVGLGHQLMYTTPESLYEQLPLRNRRGDLVLTAQARVDNRAELIAALDLRDRPASTLPDGELILGAYERWGERCPERILGDFAFAIWDERRQTLFCARDHVGTRPFYYSYLCGRQFAFASEIKALLAVPGVSRAINKQALANRLIGVDDSLTETLFLDIVRLEPGQTCTVSREGLRLRRYWTINSSGDLRLESDDAYAVAFRETFREAVGARTRSVLPLGSLLSGGLDSSSIVCTARQLLQGTEHLPLHTFSAIWPSLAETAPKSDERRYVQAVVAGGQIMAHYVHADQRSPMSDLDEIIRCQDEVYLGFNLYMDWALFKAARVQGVRALLSGHDGDSVVSYGYDLFAELARHGHWLRLLHEAHWLRLVNGKLDLPSIIWQFGVLPNVPEPLRQLRRRLQGRRTPTVPLKDFLGRELREVSSNGAESTHHVPEVQAAISGLNVHAMEVLDKVGATFNIELRYPFFDRRMVELCVALPLDQKMKQGWSRSILRRAMEGILPPAVQWRKGKADIGANFRRGLLENDQAHVERVLGCEADLIAPYLSVDALRAARQRFLHAPQHSDTEAIGLFLAVAVARWLSQIVAGGPGGASPLFTRPEDPDPTQEPLPISRSAISKLPTERR